MQQLENQHQQISYLSENPRTTHILKRRVLTEKYVFIKKIKYSNFTYLYEYSEPKRTY
jgi:hypothetical protein